MTIQTVVNFEQDSYKELCQEMRDLLQQEAELANRKKALKAQIISQAGGDRMEYGIKVQRRERAGSVDYKSIAQSLASQEKLEFLESRYRKPTISYYEVKSY